MINETAAGLAILQSTMRLADLVREVQGKDAVAAFQILYTELQAHNEDGCDCKEQLLATAIIMLDQVSQVMTPQITQPVDMGGRGYL